MGITTRKDYKHTVTKGSTHHGMTQRTIDCTHFEGKEAFSIINGMFFRFSPLSKTGLDQTTSEGSLLNQVVANGT